MMSSNGGSNSFGQSTANYNQQKLPTGQFSEVYEIQSNRVRLSNLIGTSKYATASGSVGTGSYMLVSTQLKPTQYQIHNMAIPFVAIYEGTTNVGSMQIYPAIGSGITVDKFRCYAGFDWQAWATLTAAPYKSSYFAVTVHNANAGTTANLFVVTQWKYVNNLAGTSQ